MASDADAKKKKESSIISPMTITLLGLGLFAILFVLERYMRVFDAGGPVDVASSRPR
jgi:hypothetical protein